jgi:hypothetical protein
MPWVASMKYALCPEEWGLIHIVACRQGQDSAPARVMVFVESEEAARRAATPLRSGLWGEHKVAVLLPHGEEPIQVRKTSRRRVAGRCYKERVDTEFPVRLGIITKVSAP